MTIYIDIFFIVNLYVDYFILLSVKHFLHLKVRGSRILFASVVGGVLSLFSLLDLGILVNYLSSFLFAGIITFTAFYKKNIKLLIKPYACFLTLSFGLSGLILILSQYSATAVVVGGKPYFQISPILLFIFTVISYFISEILSKIQGARENEIDFCKVIIEEEGEKIELFAKIDTGNSLKEPFSGLPVMVAEKSELEKFEHKGEVFRLIPYNSLGGTGLLPAYKPQNIYMKKSGKHLNCYLAMYDGKLSAGSYNCLINSELI